MDKKTVFLLDGLGAVVSCLCLGAVLPAVQSWIGMPTAVLHGLALVAGSFALYSLSCFFFANHDKPRWLLGIIALNLAYCFLSLALLCLFWSDLTTLGVLYFAAEKLIVLGIVLLEWKIRESLLR